MWSDNTIIQRPFPLLSQVIKATFPTPEKKKNLKGLPLDLFNMHCVAYRNTILHKCPPVWRTNDWEKSKHPFSGPGVNADNSEHTCGARSVCHCLLSRKTFHLLRRGEQRASVSCPQFYVWCFGGVFTTSTLTPSFGCRCQWHRAIDEAAVKHSG